MKTGRMAKQTLGKSLFCCTIIRSRQCVSLSRAQTNDKKLVMKTRWWFLHSRTSICFTYLSRSTLKGSPNIHFCKIWTIWSEYILSSWNKNQLFIKFFEKREKNCIKNSVTVMSILRSLAVDSEIKFVYDLNVQQKNQIKNFVTTFKTSTQINIHRKTKPNRRKE